MSSSSYSTIVRHARHLSTAAYAAAAGTASASMTISKAKSKLKKERDPDKTLEIYSAVKQSSSSPGTHFAQQTTVRRLAKSHRFSDIETLIESHKKDPRITDERFLCSLIRSYGTAGMFDHALETYNQMEALETPRSTLSFNALLTASIQSKNFSRAPQLFDEMPAKYGFTPDEYSYGILIKCYCDDGQPELGIEKFKEMDKKGIKISGVTFTTVIHSLYKKGMLDEAERIWNKMASRGCLMDVTVYNVKLMNAADGDPKKVMDLINKMRRKGLKPDIISYNYLLSCYCKNGMTKEAKKVYENLEKRGCSPNAATFRTWVFHLCKNEQFETAYYVFRRSVKLNKIPDFETLKYLVEGLAKNSRTKDVRGMIRTMKKWSSPDHVDAWLKMEKDLSLASVGPEDCSEIGKDHGLASVDPQATSEGEARDDSYC